MAHAFPSADHAAQLEVTRVMDTHETMCRVLFTGDLEAGRARIKVRADKTLEAHALDTRIAQVAERMVHNGLL